MRPRLNNLPVLIALQLLACWPVWVWYVRRLTNGADEQWGLLAAAMAITFLLTQQRVNEARPPGWLIPSLLMLLYAASFHLLPPIFRAALAVTAIGYTLSSHCLGRSFHPATWGLWLLSLPVIPSLQFYLGYPLRVIIGAMAAPILQLSGLAVVREGTCLNWSGQLIAIDAPCSGVRMLWVGLYLVFTLACFQRLSALKTLLALLTALPVLIIGNVLRATALFYLEAGLVKLPALVSGDTVHSGIGVVMFVLIAVMIVWQTSWIQRTVSGVGTVQ
jgi:exosortase/archaeosortase family protein